MDLPAILAQIDARISTLQQARALLTKNTAPKNKSRSVKGGILEEKSTKRTMSAEGRARIAAAQKKRWAKAKKGASIKPQSAKSA